MSIASRWRQSSFPHCRLKSERGHGGLPNLEGRLLIERCCSKTSRVNPDEACKQRLAITHIETERWGEVLYSWFESTSLSGRKWGSRFMHIYTFCDSTRTAFRSVSFRAGDG